MEKRLYANASSPMRDLIGPEHCMSGAHHRRVAAVEHGGQSSIVLLDVREPDECGSRAVADSIWIPMREIPQRLGELDRSCRSS